MTSDQLGRDLEQGQIGRGYSRVPLARRLIPPLLMLIVAGGIYMYAQHQREREIGDVRAAARQLCEQVAQMPPGGALPPKARQLQARLTTIEQLQTVLAADPELNTLSLAVARGDAAPPYGDGSATHQVSVVVHGTTGIVLRFRHPGDANRLRLIGYWIP